MLPLLLIPIALAPTGVRWQPTPPVHVNCDGNNAVTNLVADLDGHSGDTITARWELNNPACAGQEIRFAFHSTASSQWNENEVQPLLLGTAPVHAEDLTITWQIPDAAYPACHVQIDLITGDPHGQIDRTHRYNEFPIGGTTSRLLAAGYAEDLDCQPPATTTTTATPPTSTPVDVPPTTPDTITVSNWTPVPSTPDAVPTDTTAVELLTQQRLPETGVGTVRLLWLAGLNLAVGAILIGVTKIRRRKEHHA